jgi:PKHD-type hydroxylase
MFLEIPDLLTAPQVKRLREIGRTAPFVDGRASNPHSKVKNNLQVDAAAEGFRECAAICNEALSSRMEVRNFAFPKIMTAPMMTKYTPGMNYGVHSDAAFLPMKPRPMRSDISCTIFLHDPDSYDGGELSVLMGTRAVAFKLPAGGAIVYPSNTLHEVKPVTRGERLTVIAFMESRIADQTHRELLFQLNEVKELEGLRMAWENRTRLSYVSASLERLWSDPG